MGTLFKYTKQDMKEFLEIVETVQYENYKSVPNAPIKSKRLTGMIKKWKCHGVVRELFPRLSSKNASYNVMVNSLDNLNMK